MPNELEAFKNAMEKGIFGASEDLQGVLHHVSDAAATLQGLRAYVQALTLPEPAPSPPPPPQKLRLLIGDTGTAALDWAQRAGLNGIAGPPTAWDRAWGSEELDYAVVKRQANERGLLFVGQQNGGPQDGNRVVPAPVPGDAEQVCWPDTGCLCVWHRRWADVTLGPAYYRPGCEDSRIWVEYEPYKCKGAPESDVRFRPHIDGEDYEHGPLEWYTEALKLNETCPGVVLFQADPFNPSRTEEARFAAHHARLVIRACLDAGKCVIVADTRLYWARLRWPEGHAETTVEKTVTKLADDFPGAEYALVANMSEKDVENAGLTWEEAIECAAWLWREGQKLDGSMLYRRGEWRVGDEQHLDAMLAKAAE